MAIVSTVERLSSPEKLRLWKSDVTKFAWDHFKFVPDAWQKKLFDAFSSQDKDKQRIALRACAGPGKTAAMAICGWNFMSCYGALGEHPKGAAMSITGANLRDNLWAELSKWQGRSEFLKKAFTWNQERIFANDHPSTWFLSARSFSKSANADEIGRTLSGLHSKFLLYLVDESGDIPPQVMKSVEQGLSTGPDFAKVLQAGNPTSHSGMLYAAAGKNRSDWMVITITGDPDDPERSPRIDIEWARKQIALHGRDNPWVMAYILGKFPPSAINTLFGVDEVEAAMGKHLTLDKYDWAQKRLGVDVARFGDDSTIIFPRQGLASFKCVEMRNARSNEIAARVVDAKVRWGSECEFIDGTGGFGAGVVDSMMQAGHSPFEIHFAGAAINPKYLNKRAEMWFSMAEWVKRGGALPNDTTLAKELVAPIYYFQNGKFQLESKEQIKKRLGFSPDRGDALALTFALPDMPAQNGVEYLVHSMRSKHVADYDPFSSDRS